MSATARNWPSGVLSLHEMLKIIARDFVQATGIASRISGVVETAKGKGQFSGLIDDEIRTKSADHLKSLLEYVEAIEARVTAAEVRRAIARLEENTSITYEELGKFHTSIMSRLYDELDATALYYFNPTKTKYLEACSDLFGHEFAAKFPGALYDLDEAAKCLAMDRSTAAVFHLMRIVELGLHAIHSCLGIQTPLSGADRNWGSILRRVRDEIDARPKGKGWSDHDYFDGIYFLVDSVKDAWRNATMHVENKYTEEEAEDVFRATKSLMQRIASRMDETGQPKS